MLLLNTFWREHGCSLEYIHQQQSNPFSATVCSCVTLQEPQADGWGKLWVRKAQDFDSGSWVCVICFVWLDLGYRNGQEKIVVFSS